MRYYLLATGSLADKTSRDALISELTLNGLGSDEAMKYEPEKFSDSVRMHDRTLQLSDGCVLLMGWTGNIYREYLYTDMCRRLGDFDQFGVWLSADELSADGSEGAETDDDSDGWLQCVLLDGMVPNSEQRIDVVALYRAEPANRPFPNIGRKGPKGVVISAEEIGLSEKNVAMKADE